MAGIVTVEAAGRELGLSRARGSDVVARLAVAAAEAQSLRELVQAAADLALEAVPAERCSIFLADEAGTVLRPAWSTGPADRALWREFRRMPPVDLTAVPARLRLFRSGRVAPVADLARSSLAPAGLPRAFGARAALLAPLVANGDALGLVVFDWSRPGRLFAAEEREAAAAVTAVLALAVARFRPTPGPANAAVVRRVAAAARSLHGAGAVPDVFERVDEALHELLGVRLAAADMLLGDRLADTGTLRWRPATRATVPTTLRLPLLLGGRRLGAASVDLPAGRTLRPYEVRACADLLALAVEAAARLANEAHMRRVLRETDVLRRLSEAMAGATGAASMLREANRVLRPALGVSLDDVAPAKAPLRQALGARAPEGPEVDALRSWRAVLGKGRSPLRPRPVDEPGHGAVLVPLAHRGRVLGVLRATVPAQDLPALDDVLVAVGAACAEVVYRAGFLREVAESERRLAVAAERERIAQDLHDSVAQIVTGMGMRLAQYVADVPDKVWRARMEELLRMAGRGNRQIRQSIHELLFLDARRDGLVASLRELVRTFETSTGLPVRFLVKGTPRSMATAKEDALFRMAHEALMNIERHSRASLATVQLTYGLDGVALAVRDDGVGLGHRDPFGAGDGHFGIRAMQQRLAAAGGELRVSNAKPRGVVVEGRIEKKGVANERRARRRGR